MPKHKCYKEHLKYNKKKIIQYEDRVKKRKEKSVNIDFFFFVNVRNSVMISLQLMFLTEKKIKINKNQGTFRSPKRNLSLIITRLLINQTDW